MNWEAIGAIGEILGAITVIGTLFYLARQISQSSTSLNRANEHAQSSSIHDSNSLYASISLTVANDPTLASIYHRALNNQPLDEVESVRFTMLVKTHFIWAEDLFFQQEADLGFAVEGGTAMFLETVGPYMRRLLANKAAKDWWHSEAKHHFTPNVFEAIQGVLDDEAVQQPMAASVE
jgi:hypothetical protein